MSESSKVDRRGFLGGVVGVVLPGRPRLPRPPEPVPPLPGRSIEVRTTAEFQEVSAPRGVVTRVKTGFTSFGGQPFGAAGRAARESDPRVLPPVDPGFRRREVAVVPSADGRGLLWVVTDEEVRRAPVFRPSVYPAPVPLHTGSSPRA